MGNRGEGKGGGSLQRLPAELLGAEAKIPRSLRRGVGGGTSEDGALPTRSWTISSNSWIWAWRHCQRVLLGEPGTGGVNAILLAAEVSTACQPLSHWLCFASRFARSLATGMWICCWWGMGDTGILSHWSWPWYCWQWVAHSAWASAKVLTLMYFAPEAPRIAFSAPFFL